MPTESTANEYDDSQNSAWQAVGPIGDEHGYRNPCYPTRFSPRIISFGKVHCAIDFDMANLCMVEVKTGYVAVDAGSNPRITARIVQHWEQLSGGSLQSLIYTHSHPDHIWGADAFPLKGVDIWAHRNFLDVFEDAQLLPHSHFLRGAKLFGYALPECQVQSGGIGPPLRMDNETKPPLRLPTRTFDQHIEFAAGGINFVLQWAPGETHDHLFVWVPELRVLIAGDNLYQAFPNLYSLRGVPPRPVRQWIDSLDAMRRLKPRPEVMLLGHTSPVQGAERIYQLLTDYRDAIAFVHDSVVRGINTGKTPDQLAREIRLPDHLAGHPYLREHYGCLAASIRGIYSGYLGWFDGDAANIDPITNEEIASWISNELGGRGHIIRRVQQAVEAGQLRKALWFCQLLQGLSPNWRPAREAKAQVLELLAERSPNPLVRNWKLTDAALLRNGKLPDKPKISGATIRELPIERILRLLPSRINPQRSAHIELTLGFDLLDLNRQFTLFIRRGVGELAPGLIHRPSLIVRAHEQDLKRIFLAGDVPPTKREFWQRLILEVPGSGRIMSPIQKLATLVRLSRLFIRL